MLKLRIAICLALLVATLTFVIGLINEARLSTIMYRVLITIVFFGICGLLFGSIAENYVYSLLKRITDKGQKAADTSVESGEQQGEQSAEFSPFTPDNFEHIVPKKE